MRSLPALRRRNRSLPIRVPIRRHSRTRRAEVLAILHELELLDTVRGAAQRYEAPSAAGLAEAARSAVDRASLDGLGVRGAALSLRSTSSWFSVLSNRSIGSIMSAASVLSVGSAASFGSAGSVLSIGSVGSVLSIGSSGSVLSIGASGGFCTIGGRPVGEGVDDPIGVGPDAAMVRHISGLLAVAAIMAAPFGTHRAA